MDTAQITKLYVYPVKSCAGIALKTARCGKFGLEHDREWVIVSTDGQVLTQRDRARMALIRPSVGADGTLTLQAPDRPPLVVPTNASAEQTVHIKVWQDACSGLDQGGAAAEWLSDFLEAPLRLLRNDPKSVRQTKETLPDGTRARIAFSDCCPLLVISEESLADLNKRLSEPLPMNRFRPSLVISGLGRFGEDRSKTLRAAEMTLHAAKPCARCLLTTIDQEQGLLKGPEPLRTLSKYRRQGEKVLFGHYFLPDRTGCLRVGELLHA